MFFLKIKYRLLMQNSEEYTDFQHLGSALELSADQRRNHFVNFVDELTLYRKGKVVKS